MPRKPLSISRASHTGKVYFSLNLKLWQTIVALLVALVSLYVGVRSLFRQAVEAVATEVARAEIAAYHDDAMDEWKRGIDAQIKGLRQADAEGRERINSIEQHLMEEGNR